MLPVVIVGHSFVRRLAHYALSIEKMNLNLRENDCAISFIGRGGLTEPKLRGMTAAILARRPAILFIEIGTNDVANRQPKQLAESVFAFAESLAHRGVRRVIISQIFFRQPGGKYNTAAHFNDRVVAYNERMRELAVTSAVVMFWRHRCGMWSKWQALLTDGVHYTVDGNRRYFSSVRGAVIAASNELRREVWLAPFGKTDLLSPLIFSP